MGMVGGCIVLPRVVFAFPPWFCGIDEGVRRGASLASGRRGVTMALAWSDGEESGDEESSLKRGGSGMGSGVGLASECG